MLSWCIFLVDKFFKFGGCKLFYEVKGKGEPVLIIHGMLSNHERMNVFVPDLVKANFKTIVVDLPLHGKSTGVIVSVDGIVAALKSLMTYLGFERYHILGSSLGAGVGSVLARLDSRVESFVAMVPVVTDTKPVGFFFRTLFKTWIRGHFSKRSLFKALGEGIMSPHAKTKKIKARVDFFMNFKRRSVLYDVIWGSQINCGINIMYMDKPILVIVSKYDSLSPAKDIKQFLTSLTKVITVSKGHADLMPSDLKRNGKNVVVEFFKSNTKSFSTRF